MNIQFNAGKILNIHEEFENQLKNRLSSDLKRFDHYISKLEIHITDENGLKKGPNDIECTLAAHLNRMQTIVVTEKADTLEQSVRIAIEKLKESLDSVIGRSRDHLHHSTI